MYITNFHKKSTHLRLLDLNFIMFVKLRGTGKLHFMNKNFISSENRLKILYPYTLLDSFTVMGYCNGAIRVQHQLGHQAHHGLSSSTSRLISPEPYVTGEI